MKIDFQKYRPSKDTKSWEIPLTPMAFGVVPLFAEIENHAFPIGSAFFSGKKIRILFTATHNVHDALKHESRLERILSKGPLFGSHDVKSVRLSVSYLTQQNGNNRLEFWSLEKFHGSPPTDVIIGSPQLHGGHPTMVNPLSFENPDIGETVLSVGYEFTKYPEKGISLSSVAEGSFDWDSDYHCKLLVAEGAVGNIFAKDFAKGYVRGPCF